MSYGQPQFSLSGLAATGNNQATALLIPAQFTEFTTVAPGTGCRLPAAITGSGTSTLRILSLN